MQKKILLLIFTAIVSVMVYAYRNGAAQSGIDGTGASGAAGCGQGCHSSGTSNTTTVELDSAGTAVTSYHPGATYTVKISSTNGSTSTLPKFGFQLATVLLAGAGTSPTDAGTWGTLPGSVQKTTPAASGLTETIIEQTTQISATTGTGATGTTYVESIPWTAPAAGTGSIKIYGVVNAVNNNGNNSGDKYKTATAITITEAAAAPVVASVSIAITNGSNPTCANSSLTFTATPTNGGSTPTYQWKVNGANSGTGSTFTTSTLTNSQVVSCIMTSNLSGVQGSPATSNTLTITVNTPAIPTITQNGLVLTASSGVTYQWQDNGSAISGAQSQTYTVPTDGAYSVVVTDGNGCSATSTTLNVIGTGLAELNATKYCSIYPMPNNGEFTLARNTTGTAHLTINDLSGKVVYEQMLNANLHNIKATDLPAGVYLVNINTQSSIETIKLMIAK